MRKGRTPHHGSAQFTRTQLDAVQAADRLSLVDRVFDMVSAHIRKGEIATGHRMPSVRQLAKACEISADTVARAYDKLVAHGHLDSRPGSGFYVRSGLPAPRQAEQIRENAVLASWTRLRLLQTNKAYVGAIGSGLLPADWLDDNAAGAALRTVARASQRSLAGYGDTQGYLPLRQQLQAKLKDNGIEAAPEQIIVTNGASEALSLIVMSKLRTVGEAVLIDDPGPFLLRDRLMSVGLNGIAVPREADGPDLALLRTHCEKLRPRFYFTSSVLNNPTSGHIAPHKAFQVLKLAEEFDFTIVEDDTYGDLVSPSSQITRLATLDQLQRVIHVGSLSKTLAPGLRIGYVAAEPQLVEWLMVYRTVTGIAGCALRERLAYQLLSQGGYRHRCAQLRTRLDQEREAAVEQLRATGVALERIPEAGMYLWGQLPDGLDAAKVADAMYKLGHLAAPGELFSNNKRYRSHMRFNIACLRDSPSVPLLGELIVQASAAR